MPEYLDPASRQRKFNPVNMPLKIADVRLVTAVKNMQTGEMRDVIVRGIDTGAPKYEREYGSNIPEHTRYIAGRKIEIPWPEPEILEREQQHDDTTRLAVEDETYMPSVINTPPLPPGVANELFNQHSTKMKQADGKWLKRKIVEDARSVWYEGRELRTPKQLYMKSTRKSMGVQQTEEEKREMMRLIAEEQAAVREIKVRSTN